MKTPPIKPPAGIKKPEAPQGPPSFAAFIAKKRINLKAWAQARPQQVAHYKAQYQALGPTSFDQQAKFFFNDWRKDFPLASGADAD